MKNQNWNSPQSLDLAISLRQTQPFIDKRYSLVEYFLAKEQ